jgi:hypothetical protein
MQHLPRCAGRLYSNFMCKNFVIDSAAKVLLIAGLKETLDPTYVFLQGCQPLIKLAAPSSAFQYS